MLVKTLLMSLVVSVASAATAATAAPNVVFVGDQFMYNWQQSAAFLANPNWIGQGLPDTAMFGATGAVAAAFQTALNQHPAIVFIETGSSDIKEQTDSTSVGLEWQMAGTAIIQMVQMAQRANVRIILGTAVTTNYSDYFNGWLQTYATAEKIPLVNLQYWLFGGCSSVIPAPNKEGLAQCSLLNSTQYPSIPVPTDMGYQFITQLAQTAIATNGLTIRGGYLSDMWVSSTITGADDYQRNEVPTGAGVQFTAQTTWSDGITRPMWNIPYNGSNNTASLGTWSSSNPKVMTINQQGFAVAYTSGKTQITFRSASGVTFSPWAMTVDAWYSQPEPIY